MEVLTVMLELLTDSGVGHVGFDSGHVGFDCNDPYLGCVVGETVGWAPQGLDQ